MNKFSYPRIGVTALGLYMLGTVIAYTGVLPVPVLNVSLIALELLALVLAEVWAVLYWRSQRGRLSVAALVFMTVIVALTLYQAAVRLMMLNRY